MAVGEMPSDSCTGEGRVDKSMGYAMMRSVAPVLHSQRAPAGLHAHVVKIT